MKLTKEEKIKLVSIYNNDGLDYWESEIDLIAKLGFDKEKVLSAIHLIQSIESTLEELEEEIE